jgi:hypothetical protein
MWTILEENSTPMVCEERVRTGGVLVYVRGRRRREEVGGCYIRF